MKAVRVEEVRVLGSHPLEDGSPTPVKWRKLVWFDHVTRHDSRRRLYFKVWIWPRREREMAIEREGVNGCHVRACSPSLTAGLSWGPFQMPVYPCAPPVPIKRRMNEWTLSCGLMTKRDRTQSLPENIFWWTVACRHRT